MSDVFVFIVLISACCFNKLRFTLARLDEEALSTHHARIGSLSFSAGIK